MVNGRALNWSAASALAVVAVGVLWLTVYGVTPHSYEYMNAAQGYTLQLPVSWRGAVKVSEASGGKDVAFRYAPATGEPALVLGIVAVPEAIWNQVLADPRQRIVSRELGRRSGTVFYAHWLSNSPYQGQRAREYLSLVRDSAAVIASFRLEQVLPAPTREEPALCIQVITPARNPATGELKEFPTPCDVPTGWVPVAPEVELE